MYTSSDVIVAALFAAAQKFGEKNVPSSDRSVFIPPAQYYLCAQNTTLINKDWSSSGNLTEGSFKSRASIEVVKANHLPSTDQSADATVLAKCQGNYANTIGVVMNRYAVGTVQLMDVSLESEREIRTQGTFMVGKMAVDHGALRNEYAIELAEVDA